MLCLPWALPGDREGLQGLRHSRAGGGGGRGELHPSFLDKAGTLLPMQVICNCDEHPGRQRQFPHAALESPPEELPALGQNAFGLSMVQMAAVAKSFPEQEEIGVNSRLCN